MIKDRKINLLVIGDAVTPTGFSRVLHSITGNLPDDYNISWIGVNYFGDPHEYSKCKIYPATMFLQSDPYGLGRLKAITDIEKPDIIFILNDIWIIEAYLKKIKEVYKDKSVPKIVLYFPVDAREHDPDWYKETDIASAAVTYTEFAKDVVQKAKPELNVEIVQHGIDKNLFYKIDKPKNQLKKEFYPDKADFYDDSFIVLNANRNQPRKRLDLTLTGFKLFAENKPENVKIYMHTGISDSHIHVDKFAKRLGIQKRLIVTTRNRGVQSVSVETLNKIYNVTDVGVNTSLGEGWGLTAMEHAVTYAPQIVPDNSASKELFEDCGLLIKNATNFVQKDIMTVGTLVDPVDLAYNLQSLYDSQALFTSVALRCYNKFNSEEYSWKFIARKWDEIFKRVV